jgi:hypothetical protein
MRRSSTLNNYTSSAIIEQIDSKYDIVKEVRDNLDMIRAVSETDYTEAIARAEELILEIEDLTAALEEAQDFSGISVVSVVCDPNDTTEVYVPPNTSLPNLGDLNVTSGEVLEITQDTLYENVNIVDGGISITNNSVLYINGNLTVGSNCTMLVGTGSTLYMLYGNAEGGTEPMPINCDYSVSWDPVNKILIIPIIKGLKGDIGPAGPAGTDGRDGVDGRDGSDGKDGARGSAGIDGKDGLNGVVGAPGTHGQTPLVEFTYDGVTGMLEYEIVGYTTEYNVLPVDAIEEW